MEFLSQIQFGMDMATALAICGALFSWWRNERKKRQRGINQETRGIALERLQDTLSDLSKTFLRMVEQQSQISRRTRFTRTKLANLLLRKPEEADKMASALKGYQDELGEYYEAIHRHKYLLYPVIDSLSDADSPKILVQLKSNLDEIMLNYNKVSSGWSALLNEFQAILVLKNQLIGEDSALSEEELFSKLITNEQMRRQIGSIVHDKDYWPWVKSFVPTEREDDYLKEYEDTKPLDEGLLKNTILNFMGSLINKPEELHAHIYLLLNDQLQDTSTSCKRILCSLSGISAFLLARETQSNEQLGTVIERMEGRDYFNLKEEVR